MQNRLKRKLLKDALLDAAEKLIVKKGWQAVRAREVAEEAGCALGAIYTAYPDLDSLIMEVKARILDGLDAAMNEALRAAAGPPEDRLLSLAQAYIDYAIGEPRRWKTLFEHHLPESAVLPDWYLPKLAQLFRHVDVPLSEIEPGLAADRRQALAHALFAAVHGIVTLGLEGRLGDSHTEVVRRQVEMLVRLCSAGLKA